MDLQEQAGTEEKEAEELQKQRTRQRCRMLAAMMALRGQHVAVALHGRSVNIDKLLILFSLPFFLLCLQRYDHVCAAHLGTVFRLSSPSFPRSYFGAGCVSAHINGC